MRLQYLNPNFLLLKELQRFQPKRSPAAAPPNNNNAGTLSIRVSTGKKLVFRSIPETESQRVEARADDLYICSRPLFIIGKLLGLIALKGLFQRRLEGVSFRWRSFPAALSLLQLALLFLVTVFSYGELFQHFFGVQLGEYSSRLMILETRGPLLLTAGTLTHMTFLTKSKRMVRLFGGYRLAANGLLFATEPKGIYGWINILAFANLLPSLAHALVLRMSFVGVFGSGSVHHTNFSQTMTNVTILEKYYHRFSPHWAEFVPYHPVAVVLILLALLMSIFALVFAETLILIWSRLLYQKFKDLYVQTQLRITPVRLSSSLAMFRKTSIETMLKQNLWLEMRKDHLTCLHLLWEAERILSPLVFISYAMTIYLIIMQVHQGITPAAYKNNYLESTLASLTLAFLLLRILAVSLVASKINDYAHAIIMCIQKCPNQLYTSELERLERMLSNTTVGLSGLGCFVISRAFLLVMGSVIFTFEIVLMTTPGVATIKFN